MSSGEFLRLVARTTKFDPKAAKSNHALQLFTKQKSTQSSHHANSSKTAAALDFFGSAASSTSTSVSSSSSASSIPSADKKQGKKRAREEGEKEEKDGHAQSDEGEDEHDEEDELVDDGENDLDEEEDEGEDDADADDGEEGSAPKSASKRVKEFRRNAGIHVQGSDIPPPFERFEDLRSKLYNVPEYMISNISRPVSDDGCGYDNPTPIQQQAIPILLKGRELLACAPTGSGKTASFVVPILAALKRPEKVGFRALILAPTRELAEQTHRCFNTVAKGRKWKIFHLSKANANSNTFGSNSATKRDVLITTPMRLVHLIENGAIDLSHVEYLIMDEADRLFELGFLDQVDTVMSACTNPTLKRALFSATMMQGVETLARTVLRDPIRLTVGARNSATNSIKQELMFVSTEEGKLMAFRQMIHAGLDIPVLIFVQSKERAQQLYNELVYENLNVDVIHAERTQHQRTESIKKFRAGIVWVLICTDLMARGIDFKNVNTVINYDFPQSAVSYIHRIGRTGRAGRAGKAVTFFTEQDKVRRRHERGGKNANIDQRVGSIVDFVLKLYIDSPLLFRIQPLLHTIAKLVQQSGSDVPDWMLKMNKIGTKKAKRLMDQAPARPSISLNAKANSANKRARDRKKKRKLAANGGEGKPSSASTKKTKD